MKLPWNIMLATDSYKASHTKMYPDGMDYMESYFEARGGDYNYTMFFGLQYYIKEYLLGIQITKEKIEEAKLFYSQHFGNDDVFDYKMWEYILEKCNGYLPIKIEAVKEGSIVPISNVLFKISNTDKNCAKLVNWVETLLMKLWYPITIASNSMTGKQILEWHRENTSQADNVDFLLHDFGYRGVASEEQAAIGGAAHLLSFRGTDNIAGIRMLQYYYNAPMCGFSVPATEHSVMVAGLKENEIQTYKNILKLYPEGIVSVVSDTWDVYNVCKFLSTDLELKEMILNRNGKLVIRPDSGDIAEVLLKCLDILAEGFGYTTHTKEYTNPKNGEIKTKEYKTINSKLGLLQGDGIDIYTMQKYLSILEQKGWSMDNLVWGSGGGLLQKVNRDTIKAAIKASYIEVNGIGRDIQKDPITAQGSKKSKAGKQYLIKSKDGYRTISQHDYIKDGEVYALDTVYQDGILLKETTYDDIQNVIKEEMLFHSNSIIEENI